MTNPTDPTPKNEFSGIVIGMLLLLLVCHPIAIQILSGFAPHFVSGFMFWQLFYVVPLVIILRQQGQVAMAKGVIIAAVLTALVNGACFVLLFGIGL
jgi:hypothetical protein